MNCLECLEEFVPSHRAQMYCCKTCSNRAKAKAQRGKAKKPRTSRRCPSCKETFKVPLGSSNQKYCSKPCSNKGRPKKTKPRTCQQCKKPFDAYHSLESARGKKKFCSRECYAVWRREHRPPKLTRTYVDNLFGRLVRRRDGCCLYCGTTEHLHCSHVVSRRVSVLRADLDNAITLCYYHHLHFWHKDPIAAGRWFEQKWPGRYDRLVARSQEVVKVDWYAEYDRLRELESELTGQPRPKIGPARRTHCKRGHALSEANLLVAKDGRRRCKECHRLRELKRRGSLLREAA